MMSSKQTEFSTLILNWFKRHGRKDLPWQQDVTPYRVWISEIMLQQTQVATVIPYYQKFMNRFATLESLAEASQDEVLHFWSGLGYYARARNLHKTSKIIVNDYASIFPTTLDEVQALPGIGRSTAGAILSLAMNQAEPILDGNVKRVLARHFAVDGWPGTSAVLKQLWVLTEDVTPKAQVAAYNQAMMDMGATLCTRSRPQCEDCPIAKSCIANQQGNWQDYPGKKPKKTLPVREVQMLLLQNTAGEVLLQKRPATGVWGGLWSFPETPMDQQIEQWCLDKKLSPQRKAKDFEVRRHTFSHFHLDILPRQILLAEQGCSVMESDQWVWYNVSQPDERGLAAPVSRLLKELQS